MYRVAKLFHLLGLTLFLGSVFGHIVASIGGGEPGSAAFLAARENISLATRYLTLPGLALALVSGLAMAGKSGLPALRQRWLLVHAGLAIAIVATTATIVGPAGQRILAASLAFAHNEPGATLAAILDAKSWEDAFGRINLALALAAIVIGVFKPRLSRRAGPTRAAAKLGTSSTP